MIEPSLATLLPNTPFHTFGDLRPFGDILRNAVDDLPVFFLSPRSPDKYGLRTVQAGGTPRWPEQSIDQGFFTSHSDQITVDIGNKLFPRSNDWR